MPSSLKVYLEDHRAGALAGSELAAKLCARHRGRPDEPFYAELARAIDEDRAALDEVMAKLGLSRNRFKETVSWMGERLSRIKFSERMTGSSELSTLFEAETLSLGIEGKLALWKSLKAGSAHDAELRASADFDELIARAQSQLHGLESRRLGAAADLLRSDTETH
jgi:hypothetical protein